MQSRWFNAAIVMLWLATMSWLVKEKVLPSLLIGDPPNYSRIVEAQRDAPPVGWRMTFNGQPLGWALSDTKLQPSGLTEIYGRVHFETLPLEEVMPTWLRSLVRLIRQPIDQLRMDARSVLTIDPLGHLLRFDSSVHVDPLNDVICVQGMVEGQQLQLTVRSGEASFKSETFLPSDALLCDSLSPQTKLPGLRVGQKWTMPVYSPFWSAKNPIEIVLATVKTSGPITWNGESVNCRLVEYRSDPGTISTESQHPRGKLWVRYDGTVLRQQVFLFNSIIRFDRLPDNEALKLAEAAGQQWWSREIEFQNKLRWAERSTATPLPFPSSFDIGPLFRLLPAMNTETDSRGLSDD